MKKMRYFYIKNIFWNNVYEAFDEKYSRLESKRKIRYF